MILIEDILSSGANLINQLIKVEFRAQGHTLTGEFENSLNSKVFKTRYTATLQGTGLKYGKQVDEGFQPDEISPKMIPGLVEYFIKRGLSQHDALRAASATFKKWQSEGMSTQASKRFSTTGARQHFIEAAFIGYENKIDEFFFSSFDFGIDETFKKVKSETI